MMQTCPFLWPIEEDYNDLHRDCLTACMRCNSDAHRAAHGSTCLILLADWKHNFQAHRPLYKHSLCRKRSVLWENPQEKLFSFFLEALSSDCFTGPVAMGMCMFGDSNPSSLLIPRWAFWFCNNAQWSLDIASAHQSLIAPNFSFLHGWSVVMRHSARACWDFLSLLNAKCC